MIIFDDYEYVKLVLNHEAPDCIHRNPILRSCAKMVNIGAFEHDAVFDALKAYPKMDDLTEELFDSYLTIYGDIAPYKPREVSFGLNEIKNVNKLPRKLEKKYYLYQLYLFKYFGVHRMRVAGRELKRLAGINPNHLPLDSIHLGRGITVRREKLGTRVMSVYKNNKPYTYYYPKEQAGKTVFTFMYDGDCFMQPNVPYNSNSLELWDKFLEARDLYL